MKYLSLGLRGLLTLAFVAAGIAKLVGVGMMIDTFDAVGVGQWFRYLTGFIEIAAAFCCGCPANRFWAQPYWARRWSALCWLTCLSLGPRLFRLSFLASFVRLSSPFTVTRSSPLWAVSPNTRPKKGTLP